MPRKVKEWIGKKPGSIPPVSVKLRIDKRETKDDHPICHICGTAIKVGESKHYDHKEELRKETEVTGPLNRESNIFPTHAACNTSKAVIDNKIKAKENRQRARHTGVKKPKGKIQSPGFAKSEKRTKIDKSAMPALGFRPMFKVKT